MQHQRTRLFSQTPPSSVSEAHLRIVLESLPAGAYTCDPDGLITYFNQHAVSVWGRAPALHDPRDRFCGSFRLLSSDGRRITHDECWMARALKERDTFNAREIIVEQPSGRRLTVLAHANPLFDDSGTLLGAVNVLVDITERKQAEETRRRIEVERLHAQKLESLGVLAGGMAHELNNMLAIILGYAELAARDLSASAASELAREHLDEIERASTRARDLVRQVLTFSRRQPRCASPLSLSDVARETAALLRATVPRGVELTCDVAPNVPPIVGDHAEIEQVLINLGTNAWHSLGGRPGRVEIRLERAVVEGSEAQRLGGLRPGLYARLSVADSGSGIEPENVARIFDPFFTTKGPGTGTGLGLSVVHGIVQSHDGAIDVRSRVGEGSVFDVYLPAGSSAPRPSVVPARAHVRPGANQGVLVLDDEPALAKLATRRLDAAGYRVDAHANVRAALNAFHAAPESYALALIDLNMPEASGLDVARQLLEVRPGLPIIILSGNFGDDAASTAQALGLTPLRKPLSITELMSAIDVALGTA